MKTSEIPDPIFRQAVEAIDSGDIKLLGDLLVTHSALLRQRLEIPDKGYFKHPFLFWFVADNPIRIEKLPVNILDIASLLIQFAQQEAGDTLQEQLDYALGLIATGRAPRECGVQNEMMDALLNAGAKPPEAIRALSEGNVEGAKYLISRGVTLTLAAAAALNDMENAVRLEPAASDAERQTALAAAAYYGHTEMLSFLLGRGANPNTYPDAASGFHSHGTPLHQAVASGSLESVKVLVESGAERELTDCIFSGTPLGWAIHMQGDDEEQRDFSAIIEYLEG